MLSQERQKKQDIKKILTVKDVAVIGLMIAIIEVCKFSLSFLPNIETTTFWLIMFTLFFGWKIVFVVPAIIFLEASMYGVQLWVIMYSYIWPLLVVLTLLMRQKSNVWFWTIFSAIFGLFFGFLCSFPYFFIGAIGNDIKSGLIAAFTWWVAGIPWDIVHCIGNFAIMLVLYKPIRNVLNKVVSSGLYNPKGE